MPSDLSGGTNLVQVIQTTGNFCNNGWLISRPFNIKLNFAPRQVSGCIRW